MYKTIMMLMGCTIASIANAGLKPEIGALDIYMRPQAVQNVLNDLDFLYKAGEVDLPIETFDLDLHWTFNKFGIDIVKVDINNVTLDAMDIKSEEFNFDSNESRKPLHINLKGIDGDVTVDGSIDLLGFFKIKIETMNVTDLTLKFNPHIATTDLNHWRLIETNSVDFQDLKITVSNKFAQEAIDFIIPYVLKYGKPIAMREVSKVVDSFVNKFNIEVRDEKPTSWKAAIPYFVNDISYALTTSPEIDAKQNYLAFNFKGLFVDPKTGKPPKQVHVPTTEPPFFQDDSHQAQLWLHESLINSGVLSLNQTIFPISLKDKDISDQVKQLVFQLNHVYGHDSQINLDISIKENDGSVVQFSKTKGVMIGQSEDLKLTVEFIAHLPNGTDVSAFTLQTKVMAQADVTAQDFIVTAKANEIKVNNTKVTENNMGLYHMEWDMILNNLLTSQIETINNMLYEPIDCVPIINKLVGFNVTNFVSNSTVNAQMFDEFLYFGLDTVDISV